VLVGHPAKKAQDLFQSATKKHSKAVERAGAKDGGASGARDGVKDWGALRPGAMPDGLWLRP
jgi:hypothetical protein